MYLLYSERIDRFYIGSTELAPAERLLQHNSLEECTVFTAKGQPWRLVLTLACETRLQAVRVERHIKRMKSRRYVQNLLNYPEMQKKLLSRYVEI